MDTIYLNDFKSSFSKYYKHQNILFDDLHVLIYSNDSFLLDCVLQSNLWNKFKTNNTILKTSYNNLIFEYNQYFSIFDMHCIQPNFNDFVTYIHSIAANKVLFDMKVHIIFKNIHLLSKNQQSILAVLIESLKAYTVICTTISVDKIIDKIKSRMFCKKEIITNILPIIKNYTKDQGITDTSLIKNIEKNKLDLYASILHLHTGLYLNIIETELNIIFNCIKKTKNVNVFISKVRESIYKLLIYNVSHRIIMNNILKLLEKKYKKSVNTLIHMIHELSILDHDLLFSAKPIYHFELFFLKLYKKINQI